ncbi:MAG: histidinol-phosphate transaminase [Methanomicrobia archaeon]|nr:histidinol-phosphate transaminase [Methanomicrobia archaeon]
MPLPVRPFVEKIAEYKPGKLIKGAIKLSSNENPLGPSPLAVSAVLEAMEAGELNFSIYPWGRNVETLRDAIAEYAGVFAEKIVIGAGIDGVMDTLVKIFVDKGDEAIIPIPTFSLYESLVHMADATPMYLLRSVEDDYAIPAADIIAASTEKTKMIFLASPNNPTGNRLSGDDVRTLAESIPEALVVLDEAYVEFAEKSSAKLVNEYENVLVLRTFSKAFGLAGLRVGYAIVPEWVIGNYRKVSLPFTVNNVALIAAVAALKDKEHLRRSVELVKEGRSYLIEQLHESFRVYPSQANFVLVDVAPKTSAEVCKTLERKRITVRDCAAFRGAGNSLIRISVGTPEQNEQVVAALRRL